MIWATGTTTGGPIASYNPGHRSVKNRLTQAHPDAQYNDSSGADANVPSTAAAGV